MAFYKSYNWNPGRLPKHVIETLTEEPFTLRCPDRPRRPVVQLLCEMQACHVKMNAKLKNVDGVNSTAH